jgi:hypothetical protein
MIAAQAGLYDRPSQRRASHGAFEEVLLVTLPENFGFSFGFRQSLQLKAARRHQAGTQFDSRPEFLL